MNITLLIPDVPQDYYDPDFLIFIESHLPYLRTYQSSIFSITEQQADKYHGDLFGLFDELGVNKKHHHVLMRVNGYHHSGDYDGKILHFIRPDFSEFELLKNIFDTKKG